MCASKQSSRLVEGRLSLEWVCSTKDTIYSSHYSMMYLLLEMYLSSLAYSKLSINASWVGKEFTRQEAQEMWVGFLGQEDLLKKEMATHSRILAWKIPWTEEPGRLQSTGSQRVGHNWVTEHAHCYNYSVGYREWSLEAWSVTESKRKN